MIKKVKYDLFIYNSVKKMPKPYVAISQLPLPNGRACSVRDNARVD